MRVVVAGGTGFLGAAITRALLDAGHSVAVLTRGVDAARRKVDRRAEPVEWDARSPGPWERALDGAGGVINLAGEPLAAKRWTPEQKERLRASRVDATTALVRAIEKSTARPGVLVSASAIGYYGPRGDERLGENAPAGSDFLAQLCQEWERAARSAEPLGVRVVLVRLGVVLGEGGGVLEKMVPLFRKFAGGPMGNGRQWMSWIHREDVAGLFQLALAEEELQGPLNATAPAAVTNAEFSRTLGRVLGRPALLPAPAPALRLLLGEMADLLLTGQRVEPSRALRLGYRFRFPDLEAALRSLIGK